MSPKLFMRVVLRLLLAACFVLPASASVVLSDHSLFVLDRGTSTISRVDPDSGSILNSFAAPATVYKGGLATDGTSLYFATPPGDIFVLDPETGTVLNSYASPVEAAPFGVSALGFGITNFGPTLFGLSNHNDLLLLLDPLTGNLLNVITAPVSLLTGQPVNFADGLDFNPRTGTIFVGDFVNGFIHEIDPNTGALLTTFPPPGALISGIAFIGDRMFAVDRDTGDIFEIDPTTGANLGSFSSGVASPYGLTGFDAAPPTLTIPPDVIEECTSPTGQAVVLGDATAFDPFDSMPVISNDAPSTFFLGTTVVTWTATDVSGNAVSAPQSVEIVDTTPPMLTPPAAITVECTNPGGESIALGMANVLDICDASPAIGNDSPGTFPLGTTVVTWTATDASGNMATATQDVTVRDTTPPTLAAPADVIAECSSTEGQMIDIGFPSPNDLCDEAPEVSNDAPETFFLGTTVVTWTATDGSGNSATATQNVTVVDNIAPSISAPTAVTVECTNPAGQAVALGNPTVTDICDEAPAIGNDAPALFPPGLTVVTWTATDSSGNANSATQNVTVADTTPPSITAPGAVTVECTGPGGQAVVLGSPEVSDICDPSPAVTNDAPSTFSLGMTTVTWTATDASGRSATATQLVTVQDTTAPSITAPAPVVVECTGPGGQAVVLGSPEVSDICDPSPAVTNDAPSTFSLGMTTVTWTATDASGRSATATQLVTVQDTTPPSISAPGAVVVECTGPGGQAVVLGSPEVSDICDPSPAVTNDAPSTFSLGMTTVTWTATDASGRSATATQLVTVQDTTAPSISAPGAVTVECTNPAGQTVALGNPTVTDLCDENPAVGNDAPALFPPGLTVVTWTATDSSGNANSATQNVTVQDATAPVLSLVGADPQIIECPGPYVELGATVVDACDSAPTIIIDATAVNPSVPGDYVVTYDAVDSSNNAAAQVTRTVTILDSQDPVITCPADISVNNDPGICGAVVDYSVTFTDNCPGATLNQTAGLPTGSVFPLGVTTNTFVVTDVAGNTATCTFTVTVADTEPPVINCPADFTVECENPSGAVVTFNVTAFDNCDLPPTMPEPAEGPEGTDDIFASVDFTQSSYVTDVNDLLTFDVQIAYDPSNPGTDDLFSYGVRLVPGPGASFDIDPANILIMPVPELNFDAFNGPPAQIDKDPAVLGVKGTVDVESGPTVPYTGSVIATFGLRFLTEGVFNIGLDFFNTLGPSEMIFVTGDGQTLDPSLSFGSATVTVGEGSGTNVVCVPPSGSTFPMGITTVVCTATDPSGNMSTCSFDVTVADTTAPSVTAPGDVMVECTDPAGQPVSIGFAAAADLCDPEPNVSSDAPALFMPGTTVVTWTATDESGNANTATQNVTVQDTTAPALGDLQIDPDLVDVTTSDQTVTFDLTTTDCALKSGLLRILDPSDASFMEVTFFDSGGGTSPDPGGEESPDGTGPPPGQQSFTVPVTIPQASAPGTYTVEVVLEDEGGLITTYSATGTAFPFDAESTFEVVFGSTIQTTVFENPMGGSPGPLQGATVTLDPAAPPSPLESEESPEGVMGPPSPTGMTDENGIVRFLNVPPGDYVLRMQFARPGFCDQSVDQTPVEVLEVGGALVSVMIDAPGATDCDTEAPQCTALSLLPDPIVSNPVAALMVTATVGISDDFSGFDKGTLKVFDPNYQLVATVPFVDGTEVSGDELAGTFALSFNLPAGADPGLYSVELELTDDFGNRAFHHPLDLLVPGYVNPEDNPFFWNDLVTLAQDPTRKFNLNVVFNPANGPGETIDFSYTGEGGGPLIELDQTDACLLGYVATGFAARPIESVQIDIDKYLAPPNFTESEDSGPENPELIVINDIRWSQFASLDGIFLDETSNDLDNVAYYQSIRDYIENNYPGTKIFSNPGTTFVNNPGGAFTENDYAATADVLATFENTAGDYLNNYTPPLWLEDFCASNFLHIVHSFFIGEAEPSSEETPEGILNPIFDPSFLELAESRRAGLVYFTDDNPGDGNPYNRLPFFWSEMIAALNGHNCPDGKMMKFRVEVPRPDNDDLANARPLPPTSGQDTATNVDATGEPNEAEPQCGCGTTIDSVWWTWTAPGDGFVSFDTFGSNFDTVLAIFSGTGHPLTELGCNDDFGGTSEPSDQSEDSPEGQGFGFQSAVTISVTAGTTYSIAVYGCNESGDITLAFTFNPGQALSPDVAFSEWTESHALEGADADPNADPDMDGDSNLYEAFAGSDPNDRTSSNQPVFTIEDGYLTLSVTRGPNAIVGMSCDAQAAETDMPWKGSADGETVILEDSPALFKARDALPVGDCPGRVFRLTLGLE